MAATQQSVVVTQPTPGIIQIAIGNETMTVPLAEIQAIWGGKRDLAFLLWQFYLTLRAAGVNPNTATLGQMKTAIEAQTYWWGN